MSVISALSRALAVSLLVLPTVSLAAAGVDFDQLNVPDQILDFYNGGFTANGQGPGPDFGITFSPSATAVLHDIGAPHGSHSLEIPAATVVTLDIPAGLPPIFSFYYLSATAVYVRAWDGTGGTGNLLGSATLPATGPPNFAGGIENLPGTRSFSIESSSTMWADNLTFGEGYVIPEPSTLPATAVVLVLALLLLRSRMLLK